MRAVAYGRASASGSSDPSKTNDLQKSDGPAQDDFEEVDFNGRVLLLGNHHEHARNINMLEGVGKHGIRYDRAANAEEYKNLLCNDTIAIVIAKSWWTIIPPDEHQEFVKALFRFSSFACLRLNSIGLASTDLTQLFKAIRFRDSRHKDLLVSESDDLTSFDLENIRSAAMAESRMSCVTLHPGEVSPKEARFIAAVASEYVEERRGVGRGNGFELSVVSLSGGQSDAKLLQVTPRNSTSSFVIKIGSAKQLTQEMERVKDFTAIEDSRIDPQFFFQQDVAAILFRLIDDPETPRNPAPTLYDVLRDCMQSEAGGTKPCASESDLQTVIDRTIAKLVQLNSRAYTSDGRKSLAWMEVDGLEAMDSCGIVWHIPPLESGQAPLDLRHDARAQLDSLGLSSTVHADIHLRNILVRDYREPILIDASYAGPGHPCFDLLRLECALLFQMFRLTDNEETLKEMLLRIGRGATIADVKSCYPSLCAGVTNRVIVAGMVAIRSACIQLLRQYEGADSHYHAMKLILSCQGLAMPDLQVGIIRPAIGAAAEGFRETQSNSFDTSLLTMKRATD